MKPGDRADARHRRCACSRVVEEDVQSCLGSFSQEPVLRVPLVEHVLDVKRVLMLSLTNLHTISTWWPHAIMKTHSTQREMF